MNRQRDRERERAGNVVPVCEAHEESRAAVSVVYKNWREGGGATHVCARAARRPLNRQKSIARV